MTMVLENTTTTEVSLPGTEPVSPAIYKCFAPEQAIMTHTKVSTFFQIFSQSLEYKTYRL